MSKNKKYVWLGAGAILALIMMASCASAPDTDDSNYLGNFNPQELELIVGNTIPQGKNELTPREFNLVFYPNGNAIEWDYRNSMNNIRLNLMQEDREAMVVAMEKYIAAYQSGELTEKNNKKRAYFGKTDISMLWGLLAPTYYAKHVELRFEYQLIEPDKPYFIIANASMPETTEKGKPIADGANSPANRIAFSPVQCKKVIEIIKQEHLQGIVDKLRIESEAFDIPTETDQAAGAEPKALF